MGENNNSVLKIIAVKLLWENALLETINHCVLWGIVGHRFVVIPRLWSHTHSRNPNVRPWEKCGKKFVKGGVAETRWQHKRRKEGKIIGNYKLIEKEKNQLGG